MVHFNSRGLAAGLHWFSTEDAHVNTTENLGLPWIYIISLVYLINHMSKVVDYYASAFSPESLYGFYHIVAIFSLVILVWMIGLSYLVLRANTKSVENRFMAVLLFCEGIKASFLALEVFPYASHWQGLWDILFPLKMKLFMAAQITSILLYLSFPIYFL